MNQPSNPDHHHVDKRQPAVSKLWRSKQLEYSWLRSLLGRYEDFETITADALRYACDVLDLECDGFRVAELMAAYRRLDVFPEARGVLAALPGRKRAILSNGSPAMLDAVVATNGLAEAFDAVISVDALKIYKPDPRVYQLAVDTAIELAEFGTLGEHRQTGDGSHPGVGTKRVVTEREGWNG